jgi:hypothetical protein
MKPEYPRDLFKLVYNTAARDYLCPYAMSATGGVVSIMYVGSHGYWFVPTQKDGALEQHRKGWELAAWDQCHFKKKIFEAIFVQLDYHVREEI